MLSWLKIGFLGLALAIPTGGCVAGSKSPKLARCDGKERRPANAHGSILPTVDPASGSVTPASAPQRGVDVFLQADPAKSDPRGKAMPPADPPVTLVPPIGALSQPTPYQSC